jgi:hypothetical protein
VAGFDGVTTPARPSGDSTVLLPEDTRRIVPALAATPGDVWVYRYRHAVEKWQLSIATHAPPGSGKLSLGGFRIAPRELVHEPGFDADTMAIELAMGMEEKVYWSRLIHVGGPLALRDTARIVGGKCVLLPTDDSRVGEPKDAEMLAWAVECVRNCDEKGGIHIVTGQDLGHGTMSDGVTRSLDFMSTRYHGCVDADTSKPTGEGNYYVLKGMLEGLSIHVGEATVGLIGLGNIGMHILERLIDDGARVVGVEAREERRDELHARGIEILAPAEKERFLQMPMDALVVNANKESLDAMTVERVVANPHIRVVCGSENLAMPDPRGADTLRRAHRIYCPTELGGMMGYLTAVEEYLAHLEGVPFRVETLFEAARRLEWAGRAATEEVVRSGFVLSFEDGMRAVATTGPLAPATLSESGLPA